MENKKLEIKKKSVLTNFKNKFGFVLANTFAFVLTISNSVFADIDAGEVTNSVEKIVDKLSSLLYFGAILMAIYGMYAYGKANREQDPHAKSKAMTFLEGAIGIGVAGFLLANTLKPLISKLFN